MTAMYQDTICAVATPAGSGGVGIVRISGSGSLQLLAKVFTRQDNAYKKAQRDSDNAGYSPGRMYYGTVKLGEITDTALAVFFKAPKSFTGEDVCEIHCHGSPLLLDELVKKLIGLGARHADAGEFTKRAFISGKLDLSESEGLIDIINAESTAALTAAAALHRGQLSSHIKNLQEQLKNILAHIEVTIDYSEEGIEDVTAQKAQQMLEQIFARLLKLKESFAEGRLMREGISIAICGQPNAGKSSLLNAIIGYDRAIVTDIAGTTRDSIDADYLYKGMRYKFTDTAGLRDSDDAVEKLGIQRAREVIAASDAVIYVKELADISEDFLQTHDSHTFLQVKQMCGDKPLFLALSKVDILPKERKVQAIGMAENLDVDDNENGVKKFLDDCPAHLKDSLAGAVAVSSVTGENIDKLKAMLHRHLAPGINAGGAVLTNSRHYDAVSRACAYAKEALAEIESAYLDMTAYSLMQIYNILGEITGDNSVESIIDEIFSRFCVGK